MSNKVINTTREEIASYWETRVYEGDMGCDWDEASSRCWRCGRFELSKQKRPMLQRCHIIAEQEPFNGKDEPSNFVLLCEGCHQEAPMVDDPSVIWQWIKDTRKDFENGYPSRRLLMERYGKEILEITNNLNKKYANADDAFAAFDKLRKTVFERVGYHGIGRGARSKASIAWAFQQMAKESANLPDDFVAK